MGGKLPEGATPEHQIRNFVITRTLAPSGRVGTLKGARPQTFQACSQVEHTVWDRGGSGNLLCSYGQFFRWCYEYGSHITYVSHDHKPFSYDPFWHFRQLTNDTHTPPGFSLADSNGQACSSTAF